MNENNDKQLGLFDECDPVLEPSAKSNKWLLYTDGASRRNPGPSGAGVYIVKNDESFFKQGFFLGTKTNNQAEYLALVLGLYYVKKHMASTDAVYIMSDSELLIRQMKGEYRVKNKELKQLFDVSKTLLHNVKHSFCHIMREYNVDADELANHGVDSKTLPTQAFLSFLQSHDVHI
jgi:ribonuclease HI